LKHKNDWKNATDTLQTFYIDFFMKRKAHDREKAQRNNSQSAPDTPAREAHRSKSRIDMIDDNSDEEDGSSIGLSDNGPNDEEEQLNIDRNEAILEFNRVIKNWSWRTPDWKKLFPNDTFTIFKDPDTEDETCDPDPFTELIDIDMCVLMHHIERYNSDNNNTFGYLPMMTRLSPCQLGALTSQSFVEQMNSCGKMIVGERRTRMKHEIIDILVILRMNRTFMTYSRSKESMKKTSDIDLRQVVQRDGEIFEDNI